MTNGYTRKRLSEIEDSAGGFGLGEFQETRFAHEDLQAEEIGCSYHRVKPGKRQGFGHRHENAEEVYVVLAGSGRVKLDEDVLELEPLDALRVAPPVARQFEAGPDGLELLAFGPRRKGDGEILRDWWTD